MAKRKLTSKDYNTGDEDSCSSASTWNPSKKRIKSRGRSTKPKDIADHSSSVYVHDDRETLTSVAQSRHAASRHNIISPASISKALLGWYAGVHENRGMPWRKPYDNSLDPDGRAQRAYEVWISEVMLQQTQVVTVIPYYNRWMEKFPTIEDLAASDIETVNSLWKGLGYYSRAARLLLGAQQTVQKLGGRLPDNAKDMEANIPGIGRYSAGAICSIAYNQQVPVLDGNVHRLLSRFLALYAPPKAKSTLDLLWASAKALVESTDHPGDLNQALIELGSTVCRVRDPECASCPLRTWCKAYTTDEENVANSTVDIEDMCIVCEPLPSEALVTTYPMKAGRKRAREELDIVNVVEWYRNATSERLFLLVRRPEDGLLAGLHEFPTYPNVSSKLSAPDLTNTTQLLLSWLLVSPPSSTIKSEKLSRGSDDQTVSADAVNSLRITRVESGGDIIHLFSHIKKTYRVQWIVLEGGSDEPPILNPQPARNPGAFNVGRLIQEKKARNTDGIDSPSAKIPRSMWVPLDQVAHINIGNGVLKIWNRVKTLWLKED